MLYSIQLSVEFNRLMNVKMPTILIPNIGLEVIKLFPSSNLSYS